MGDKYLKTGDFVSAIKEFTVSLSAGLDHVILCKRSLAFLYSGDARNSMVDARMSIALHPEYIKGYYCLANGHLVLSEYNAALDVCRQGLTIANSDRSLLQIVEKCERGISGAPEPDPMRFIRGSMHNHSHDHDSGGDHDHSHDHSHGSDGHHHTHGHHHDHSSGGGSNEHDHDHEHSHDHDHEHSHDHDHMHDHNHSHDHGHNHEHEGDYNGSNYSNDHDHNGEDH